MILGNRIRQLREAQGLSQGDIEKRTGIPRGYISRTENRHVVPSIETLERIASAMDVPLYRLFYEGEEVPQPLPNLTPRLLESGAGEVETRPIALFNQIRRMSEKNSGASEDARLAFRTLAKVFSDL